MHKLRQTGTPDLVEAPVNAQIDSTSQYGVALKLKIPSPFIDELIKYSHMKIGKALDVSQRVESAVLPIYWTAKVPNRPDQIGSGVVVCIGGEYFIFSASHVFDHIGTYALLIGTGSEKLVTLSGERFSTGKGPSGTHKDDPVDASVFHIQEGMTDKLRRLALSLEDFDLTQQNDSMTVFFGTGFLAKKSYAKGNIANSKRECFPSIECNESNYSSHKLDKDIHLALAFENKVLVNGNWQTSPTPRGVSGGAIIKIESISMNPSIPDKEGIQLLSAIIIEQRRGNAKQSGVLIGTRINVHLELIRHFLPSLMKSNNICDTSI